MFKAKDLSLGIEAEPGFACYRKLDPDDELYEFAPEAYLDSPEYDDTEIQDTVEQLLRDFAAFNIRYANRLK